MICNTGDLVVVPFPFTDNANAKPRPAVVLSGESFNKDSEHSILAMITTGKNSRWPSDIRIEDNALAGIATESFIRMKIFTLDNRLIKKQIGVLNNSQQHQIKNKLISIFLGASA